MIETYKIKDYYTKVDIEIGGEIVRKIISIVLLALSVLLLVMGCSTETEPTLTTEERILLLDEITFPTLEGLSKSRGGTIGSSAEGTLFYDNFADFNKTIIPQFANKIIEGIKSDIELGKNIHNPNYNEFEFTYATYPENYFSFSFSYMLIEDDASPKFLLVFDSDLNPSFVGVRSEVEFDNDFTSVSFKLQDPSTSEGITFLTYDYTSHSGAVHVKDQEYQEIRYDENNKTISAFLGVSTQYFAMYATPDGIGYYQSENEYSSEESAYIDSNAIYVSGDDLENKETIDAQLEILKLEIAEQEYLTYFDTVDIPTFDDDEFNTLAENLELNNPSDT